ncbi:hypothetical protein BRYFOR_06241 [Marvinbryantia formatexigens DSM 14469]|uniref:Uncharacterized protein n=1 Tax=Marvinbryantia formatexigens DSM 14469 TaxID=478749 RepID=C6LC94_9FIRM|nr:hypothetical protein BRYFOR_06241 [Marvinbryantia formatexigens DSM 14469]SDF15411.1 hypothetical protein SAMN05660368_00209 [Marvinbryantia formatexigens]
MIECVKGKDIESADYILFLFVQQHYPVCRIMVNRTYNTVRKIRFLQISNILLSQFYCKPIFLQMLICVACGNGQFSLQ